MILKKTKAESAMAEIARNPVSPDKALLLPTAVVDEVLIAAPK